MRLGTWVAGIVISFGLLLGVMLHTWASVIPVKLVDWSLETVVEEVMPSVVYIVYESDKVDWSGQKQKWQGSGVIIDEDGLILTARHVVEEPGKFTVTLSDGREFVTKKACVSRKYDVGYLKIDANDLHAAKFGDSDEMRLGSRLLAIGSPWGKGHFNSVTMGILSASRRNYGKNLPSYGWEVLFQTDVAANPGNSGGPVFNMSGEIVGIVVGLYGPGTYVGITYCVPSNICKRFVQSAELVFALHEVAIVEVDKRMDDIENQLTSIVNDTYDIKRRLGDIEFELAEPESFEPESFELEENYEGYWEYWE